MKVLSQFNFKKTGQGTSTNSAALSYSRERFLLSGLFYLNDPTIVPPTQRCFHSQNPPACPWKGPPPTPPRVHGGKTAFTLSWKNTFGTMLSFQGPFRLIEKSLQTYSHSGTHGKRSWTEHPFQKSAFTSSWKNTSRTMVCLQGLFRLI